MRRPDGAVMGVEFELEGQRFSALNGRPSAEKFTPAFSLFVSCATQQEVDTLWAKLTEGGKSVACGWLVDKFGVSWQIIPTALTELMQDPDPVKAGRVMQAMMKMQKIEA